MYNKIQKCRICGNVDLEKIIDLGEQDLTGIFPKTKSIHYTTGPLELVKCVENNENCCGLVQLNHTYNHIEMYGSEYGYRSGLNNSMVEHLKHIVNSNLKIVDLEKGDLIIDIGSNDGTLLKSYPKNDYLLVGIDPTAFKFKQYYTNDIQIVADFFSSKIVKEKFHKNAKIITSIAMFYDLENPLDFVKEIYEVIDEQGIWVFEQSYLPLMIERNAYDTICHEHLEYYCLKQVKWLLDKVGFKIIDIELNDTNGGSFIVTAAKKTSAYNECTEKIKNILEEEIQYSSLEPFYRFQQNIIIHKNELISLIRELKNQGKKIFGYGASTKGNVILQYCGFTDNEITYIAEINSDKFGSFTPKTYIPIVSETEAKAMKPDYFLVLPWHFKENIIKRESINSGVKFIFPLPKIEII